MKEIPLTQGKLALVDDDDFERLCGLKWHFHKRGYAAHSIINEDGISTKIFMHRLVMNCPTGIFIDHKDRNGLNNQKYNLRFCSHAQNMRNRKKQKNNTSGFHGVHKSGSKWKAKIKLNGNSIYLGRFDNPREAAKAYDKSADKYFGEFAVLNN